MTEQQSCGAICGGVNTQFWLRIRPGGQRKYRVVGRPTRSYAAAVRRMAQTFVEDRFARGEILMTADYYDPVRLCELVNYA